MKKLFLLIASGSIALSGMAQYRAGVSFDNNKLPTYNGKKTMAGTFDIKREKGAANKTTAAPKRWYSYNDWLDQYMTATASQTVDFVRFPIWNDTMQQINYTTGPSHINQPSMGMILDPSSYNFNNPEYYLGEMKIGPTDAYTVDSIALFGVYRASAAHTSVVDTIRLSFIVGGGGAASSDHIYGSGTTGGHYGAATFMNMRHDSIMNWARPGSVGIGSPRTTTGLVIQDILLDNTTYGDTTSGGTWARAVALTAPLAVAANKMVGVSISFISGEAAIPAHSIIHDYVTQTTNHNIWWPIVGFASDGTTAQWAPWFPGGDPKADSSTGVFKRYPGSNGWDGEYVPTYAWFAASGGGAAQSQFPELRMHMTCSTCGNVVPDVPGNVNNVTAINTVKAVPNPADNELNVPFTLNASANVTVTLSNMIGQVVATQNMGNVASGNAVFNTTSLPAGLYTYNVNANGQRNTGNVVIAH